MVITIVIIVVLTFYMMVFEPRYYDICAAHIPVLYHTTQKYPKNRGEIWQGIVKDVRIIFENLKGYIYTPDLKPESVGV